MTNQRKKNPPACAGCTDEIANRICMEDNGTAQKGCPTVTRKQMLSRANKAYTDPETLRFAHQASVQEAAAYANRHERPYVMQPTKTRIMEICEFARRMEYERLGLVFCIGLQKEAAVVDRILTTNGFEVVSVCCKAGRTSKDLIGIEVEDRVHQDSDESMCNPIFQAMVLNGEKTDFNILIGLCVGHDSLFFKHAEAFTTVLAVKDRVTGHNPLAAIYMHDSYYQKLKRPLK